jgi:hypothetical protein
MAVVAGPTNWWYNSDRYYACFAKSNVVGSETYDGSRLICKSGGIGWFVAPSSTQVTATWNGTTDTLVGNKPCLIDWSTAKTALENRPRPIDSTKWFIPSGGSGGQLNNPGYVCRTHWDSFDAASYWSSTEFDATGACRQFFDAGTISVRDKTNTYRVRAFRCVTY